MAEMKEVRHAGIGIQLNIGGLEEFRRLNDEIDKLMSKFKEFKSMIKGLDGAFSGLKTGNSNIIQIADHMKDMNKDLTKASEPIKDIGKGLHDVNDISKDLKKNTDFSDPLSKSKLAISGAYREMKGLQTANKQVVRLTTDMAKGFKDSGQAANGIQKNFNFVKPTEESKRAIEDYQKSINRIPVKKFSELNVHINNTKKSTEESSKSVKDQGGVFKKLQGRISNAYDTLRNSFFGNAVINGFSWLTGQAKTIMQQGYELAENGEQIREQWKNIGLSDKNAHGMTEQISDIRGKSNMAASSIDTMQKKFYELTGSIPKAKQLTNEIAAFGSAAGKSEKQIQSISSGVTRLAGSKTVSAGAFQKTFGALPALKKAVISASGMTQTAFSNALDNGKITGAQLQGYLAKSAKGSGKEWTSFSKTTKGQIAGVQGTFKNLKELVAAPMVNSLSKALDTVSEKHGGLSEVKKQLTDIAKVIGTKVGNAVGEAIQFLVKNRKPIAELGGALFTIVKNIGLGVWKVFAGTLEMISGHSKGASGGLKSVADFASEAAKHQSALQAFGKGLVGIFVTMKLLQGYNAGKNFLGLGEKAGLIFKPQVDSADGKKELTKFASVTQNTSVKIWKALRGSISIGKEKASAALDFTKRNARKAGTQIWKSLQGSVTIGKEKASKALDLIKRNAKKAGAQIWKALKGTAKIATKGAILALDLLKKAAIGVGKGFKTMGTFMKANPFIAIIAAVVAVIAIFVVLYKHNKKFRDFVNGLLKWAKKFAEDFGKEFGKFFKATVKTVEQLASNINKRWGNLWKDVINLFKDAWQIIKDVLRIFADVFTGNFSDLKKVIPKLVSDMWKYVKDYFKGAFDWLDDLTGGRLGKMIKTFADAWSNISKNWKDAWNNIKDDFGRIWSGIKDKASDGINGIIKVLNLGIKGIDWVIGKFGGSKHAIGTIDKVHLATGTGVFGSQRRAINRPTMAMLNDGHDSPSTGNREMLIHPNGLSELVKGTNVMRMLEPGAEVLNASETRMMMGVEHFAKGTGLFDGVLSGVKNVASSAWNGVTGAVKATMNTFNTVKNIVSHPVKYVEGLLTKPTGKGEVLSDFASGMYSNMKKAATSWWSSLWGMVNLDGSSQGSGSRGAFLKYAEKIGGAARGYSEGAGKRLGPDYYDCSGLVYEALKHAGVTVSGGSTTVPEYNFTSPVSWANSRPGDLAFWGTGGTDHVGIVSSTGGSGKMYNAENPNDGIKYGPIKGFMSGFAGLRRVSQLHDDDTKSSKKTNASSMSGDIKKQVGSGFFKFMDKLSDLFGSDNLSSGGTSAKPSGDHMHWLKQAGIPASEYSMYDYIISHESGWNPHATNGISGAYGLPQSLPGSKMASAGSDWKTNPITQLKWMKNYVTHGNYHSINQAYAHWKSNSWYAKGGDVPDNQLSVVGEKGWELFRPKSGGHVFDHETSKKILSGGRGENQKIEVHGATIQMTVNGNADSNTVSKLQSVMNDSNDALVDKLRQVLGLNDKGGLIV